MKKLSYWLVVCLGLNFGCSGGDNSAPETVDTDSYILTDISGTDVKRAVRTDAAGNLIEEGFLRDNAKTGTWVYYESGNPLPVKLVSYIDGKYNGLYLEFNERGQINLRASYLNNKLDGPWGKYRFGRAEEEAHYQNGKLDGVYKAYYVRTGKLQSSTEYKDGVQDGWYRFYNEEGEVTLEYEYRNGEKVSGGIVNPEDSNEPQ